MSLPDFQILFPTEPQFVEALRLSELASTNGKHLQDERRLLIPRARHFVESICSLGEDTEFSAVSRWLRNGTNGKTINCFGSDYTDLRDVLMATDRQVFDELYAPFFPEGAFNLSSLDYGGLDALFWLGFRAVISPDRCTKLCRLRRVYSVTTLVGLLADAHEDWPVVVKNRIERLADLDDEACNTLLARYQAVDALWGAACEFASRKKRVLVAYVE